MLGVSLTITGIVAASIAQPTIVSATSGFCPTAEPMPRSHMPWGQPKLSSMPSAPQSADRFTNSCHRSRVSTIREAIIVCFGQRFFTSAISRKLVSGERSLISSMLLNPAIFRPPMVSAE